MRVRKIYNYHQIVSIAIIATTLFIQYSCSEEIKIEKPNIRIQNTNNKHNKQIHNKHSQKSQTNLLKGPLKVSIKDYFPDDEFSVKLPHLSTNGTCYELPPDILEDEHPIAIAIAPARKKRQRYCKHEDFGTCGHSCCAMQIVAPKDCDTKCAYRRILRSLSMRGPDQRYRLLNATDLRELEGAYRHNIEFMIDARHQTEHYHKNQIIQLVLSPVTTMGNQALVKGFSLSVGHDSLRDFGQNYKNLAELMKSIFFDADRIAILHGCGRSGLIQSQGTASVAVGTGIIGVVIGIILTGTVFLCFAQQVEGGGNSHEGSSHKIN